MKPLTVYISMDPSDDCFNKQLIEMRIPLSLIKKDNPERNIIETQFEIVFLLNTYKTRNHLYTITIIFLQTNPCGTSLLQPPRLLNIQIKYFVLQYSQTRNRKGWGHFLNI